MPHYNFPPKLGKLMKERLDSGEYDSEDEVLLAALHRLQETDDDRAAVQEALNTLDAGEQGLSLQEAFDEVRRRNNVISKV